jgi:hypothetical protein
MNARSCRDWMGGFAIPRSPAATIAVALIAVASGAVPPTMADSPAPPIPETEVTIKRLGFGISQMTLPAKAAKRLDIRTTEVRLDASGRKIAPLSSIIYDLDGDAWVYTEPAPLSYVRAPVVVDLVKDGDVYLVEGPAAGTKVVTMGVPELYGTEVGVNGE